MNGKQLKNSILQWAIQGKLVPQNLMTNQQAFCLIRFAKRKNAWSREENQAWQERIHYLSWWGQFLLKSYKEEYNNGYLLYGNPLILKYFLKTSRNIWQLQKKVVILQPVKYKGYNGHALSGRTRMMRKRPHDVYFFNHQIINKRKNEKRYSSRELSSCSIQGYV